MGVDIVEIARVERLVAAHGERALARLFTEAERAYCLAKQHPPQHFAARLAAKEAAFKALSGTDDARLIGWREIEVRSDGHGRPQLMLHGRARARAAELGAARVWVSMTHDSGAAHATVMLETAGPPNA
jgi:holo-[acyl-carrier protein] synthase